MLQNTPLLHGGEEGGGKQVLSLKQACIPKMKSLKLLEVEQHSISIILQKGKTTLPPLLGGGGRVVKNFELIIYLYM